MEIDGNDLVSFSWIFTSVGVDQKNIQAVCSRLHEGSSWFTVYKHVWAILLSQMLQGLTNIH